MTRMERRRLRRRIALHRACLGCALAVLAVSAVCAVVIRAGADSDATGPTYATDAVMRSTEHAALVKLACETTPEPDNAEAECLARMLYGEARGCSKTEQAAVVWCALNRVDSADPFYPDDIIGVVTQESQFHGYNPDNPVEPELLSLVEDVLDRWAAEGDGADDGRVLSKEYLFFSGDGYHNYFRTEWDGGRTWDWSLASPYEEGNP